MKERVRKHLERLFPDPAQRAIYERGLAKMSDAEAAAVASDLERALDGLPDALAAARELLEKSMRGFS